MNYSGEQERNSYKTISDNHIVLDFSECKYPQEIHSILKEKFGLPEYYGENWDALEDCLQDRFCEEKTYEVKIYGYSMLKKGLQKYCQTMLEVFKDIQQEYPTVTFEIIS